MSKSLPVTAIAVLLGLPLVAGTALAQRLASAAPAGDAALPPAVAPAPGGAAAPASGAAKAQAPKFGAASKKPAEQASEFRTLDQDVQDLKKRAVSLNRDLFLLEEQLLFPANTQVAVFVAMDVGAYFGLDSIQLKLDGKDVTNYLYTEREVGALARGGVQRLYVGNVKAGDHELVAVFTGHGPHDRDYKRGASLKFKKDIGPKYIELTISDHEAKLQPEFVVKEWE